MTITGSGLTGTHAVAFGGALATSVQVVNDTTVTCVTPAHAGGVVDVILATPVGQTTRAQAYTYTQPRTGIRPTPGAWAGGGMTFTVSADSKQITNLRVKLGGTTETFPITITVADRMEIKLTKHLTGTSYTIVITLLDPNTARVNISGSETASYLVQRT